MVGEPVTIGRAFLDLGAAVVEWLAHLLRHQPRMFVLAGAQELAGLADDRGAVREGRPPPFEEGLVRGRRGGLGVFERMLVVGPARLAGRGVYRLQLLACAGSVELGLFGHGGPPLRRALLLVGGATNSE